MDKVALPKPTMQNKTRMINCLPAPSRKLNEYSNLNAEVGARCRQAVTSL